MTPNRCSPDVLGWRDEQIAGTVRWTPCFTLARTCPPRTKKPADGSTGFQSFILINGEGYFFA